jgi:hypothetical protein
MSSNRCYGPALPLRAEASLGCNSLPSGTIRYEVSVAGQARARSSSHHFPDMSVSASTSVGF